MVSCSPSGQHSDPLMISSWSRKSRASGHHLSRSFSFVDPKERAASSTMKLVAEGKPWLPQASGPLSKHVQLKRDQKHHVQFSQCTRTKTVNSLCTPPTHLQLLVLQVVAQFVSLQTIFPLTGASHHTSSSWERSFTLDTVVVLLLNKNIL